MRALSAVAVALTLLLASGASTAAAADATATLTLSVSDVHAGDIVVATGTGYAASQGTPVPVVLHWNTADGLEIAQAVPDAKGSITTLFSVPDAAPGAYVVVAVQRNGPGADAAGTPVRTAIRVLSGSPPTAPVDAATTLDTAPLDVNGFLAHSSGGPPAGVLAGGALVVVLGIAVVAGRRRSGAPGSG